MLKLSDFSGFDSCIRHLTTIELAIETSDKSQGKTQIKSPTPGQGKAAKSQRCSGRWLHDNVIPALWSKNDGQVSIFF